MNVKQDLPEIPSLMDRVRDMALCAAWLRKREIGGLSIAPTAGESPIDALLS